MHTYNGTGPKGPVLMETTPHPAKGGDAFEASQNHQETLSRETGGRQKQQARRSEDPNGQ